MPPTSITTTTATTRRRRRTTTSATTATAASCCCGLLAAAALVTTARVASGAPAALPVEGLEPPQPKQQPPPYSFDTRARTLGILQALRAGQHPLEVLDDALPGGQGEVGFSLEMRGWDGRPYACTPVMDPRPSLNATMDGAYDGGDC